MQRCSTNKRTGQGELTNQRPGINSQTWPDEKIVSSRCLDSPQLKFHTPGQEKGSEDFISVIMSNVAFQALVQVGHFNPFIIILQYLDTGHSMFKVILNYTNICLVPCKNS